MIQLNIADEISTLDSVILGISEELAGPGEIDPKSRFHLEHDSFPTQKALNDEINSLLHILIRNRVKVYRPVNIRNQTQLFTRDLGFVIGDTFFVANLLEERKKELEGIAYLLGQFDPQKIVYLNKYDDVQIEGGDVVLRNNTLFVGLSARTNHNGFLFLEEYFAGKKDVRQLELVVDEDDHTGHSLHLDCAFQPVGTDHAIVYEDGIKNLQELYDGLGIPAERIFKTGKWQFVRMFPNVLSLSENRVIIEKEFVELKYWLEDNGFTVEEACFKQVSKLSGLIRCCTLPLIRS
jgi:N-dimethylarginine dimethylaminohydrolase